MRVSTIIGPGRVALLYLLLAGSSALGQDWAEKMFDHTSHDFGTVARGAKVEHIFTVENIYEEEMRISEIRSSCGCTAPKVSRQILKTWEKAQILAEVDTRGFFGRKDATLTVVLSGQFRAEVQLHIHVYIRSDIVVEPGSVQFGSVPKGTEAVQKVRVSHAGSPDWRIIGVESPVPHIEAEAVRAPDTPASNLAYDVIVRLKADAPVGHIREYLNLLTNDRRAEASRVPLAVEGEVVSTVSVSPSLLLMGVVSPGQTITRQLVVQGKEPFRILGVECSDKRLSCTPPTDQKKLHMLPVVFVADEKTGKVSATIQIKTSLASEKPLEVPVSGQVIPPTSTEP
jgi:hypothetical protein